MSCHRHTLQTHLLPLSPSRSCSSPRALCWYVVATLLSGPWRWWSPLPRAPFPRCVCPHSLTSDPHSHASSFYTSSLPILARMSLPTILIVDPALLFFIALSPATCNNVRNLFVFFSVPHLLLEGKRLVWCTAVSSVPRTESKQ